VSLLNAEAMQKAKRAAAVLRERRHEVVRRVRFGADGSTAPARTVRLTSKDDKRLWLRHLAQQAQNEQEGFLEGESAQVAIEHPAVQKAVEEVV